MRHRASPKFWRCYERLPHQIQATADRCYELLKANPRHPSLHLKQIDRLWSVRVGEQYRAVGLDDEQDGIYWIWIGTHAEYDLLIKRG